jgi:hypothetical protein
LRLPGDHQRACGYPAGVIVSVTEPQNWNNQT